MRRSGQRGAKREEEKMDSREKGWIFYSRGTNKTKQVSIPRGEDALHCEHLINPSTTL
jgi:hypothetical protein